jgi:hypothetical protein
MRASAPRGQSADVSKKEVRVAGIGIFSLAFHRLREVIADVDRLASNEGAHADNNALEII